MEKPRYGINRLPRPDTTASLKTGVKQRLCYVSPSELLPHSLHIPTKVGNALAQRNADIAVIANHQENCKLTNLTYVNMFQQTNVALS